MEVNSKVAKMVGVVFIFFMFLFVYNTFFAGFAEDRSDEAVARAQLADFAKAIAVNQDDTGNYGIVSVKLPYIGCDLSNSYLNTDVAKNYINKFPRDKIFCVTGGANGVITKWAIGVLLKDGKYWCVDEDGQRKKISGIPSTASCN